MLLQMYERILTIYKSIALSLKKADMMETHLESIDRKLDEHNAEMRERFEQVNALLVAIRDELVPPPASTVEIFASGVEDQPS